MLVLCVDGCRELQLGELGAVALRLGVADATAKILQAMRYASHTGTALNEDGVLVGVVLERELDHLGVVPSLQVLADAWQGGGRPTRVARARRTETPDA